MTSNPIVYVDVALPIPFSRLFTYQIAGEYENPDAPLVGRRVLVPFGKRILTGIIVRIAENPQAHDFEIRPVLEVLDTLPVFSKQMLRFTQWVADYYFCSWGEVLKSALPEGLTPESVVRVLPTRQIRQEEIEQLKRRAPKRAAILEELLRHPEGVSIRYLRRHFREESLDTHLFLLKEQGYIEQVQELKSEARAKRQKAIALDPELLSDSETFRQVIENIERSAPKQALLLSAVYLRQYHNPDEPVLIADILKEVNVSASAVKALVSKGYLIEYEADILRTSEPEQPTLAPRNEIDIPLTVEQQHAEERILEAVDRSEFKTFLLYGVTASGKTVVYFRAIQRVLEQGKTTLFLVPEIALTPQLIDRFKKAFSDHIAVYHSRMSAGERFDAWNAAYKGSARILIGTRSAIFLPMKDLGIIIVDEEHDPSYKQDAPNPRYHARDCAVVRGSIEKCVVVLGSATPSLESMYNAQTGKYHLIEIRNRVDGAVLPRIHVVDMLKERQQSAVVGSFSLSLLRMIFDRLEKKEGIILLQNRRGFASWIECQNCGFIPQCPHCSVSLTFHKFRNQLRCHYCGYAQRMEEQCPECGSSDLRFVGRGTERVEEELQKILQQHGYAAVIQRMDLDTVSARGRLREILESFARKEIDILVGTQMVAKGLDFSHVTLVGVVNADVQLYLPDFRAAERTFQLLTQVAGRAGRTSGKPGEVVVQTAHPHHPVFRAIEAGSYELFYNDELQLRRAAGYPPFTRFVLIEFSGKDEEKVHTMANRFVFLLPRKQKVFEILGPAIPPLSRLRGYYRRFVAIKDYKDADPSGQILRHHLAHALRQYHQKHGTSAVRMVIDVDAQSII